MKLSADARSLLLLLALASCLWATRLRGPIDLRWDAGPYYILGTSLAEGRGYRLLNEPGDPRAIQYPPLLPALVAAHQVALGSRDPERVGHALRITYAIMYFAYVFLAFRLARHYAGTLEATLVAAMAALPVHVIFLSDVLFAELPYALVTVAFACLAAGQGGRWRAAALATLAATSFLLRTSGLALMAAWVAEALLRRRWRQALLRGAVALAPVVAWQAYIGHVRSGEAYRHPAYEYQRAPYQYYNVGYDENARLVDPFRPELGVASPGALARRLASNVAAAPAALGRALLTGKGSQDAPPGGLAGLAYAPAGLLILAGLGAFARRRAWFPPLYLLASVALICTTPWPSQFGRYLAPLAPFLALSLVLALRDIAGLLPRRGRDGGAPARPALLLAVTLAMIAKQAYSAARVDATRSGHGPEVAARLRLPSARFIFFGPPWASFEVALRWLGEHARPGDVVASSVPHQVYLRTGMKAVMFPMEADPREAQRLLDGVPARYLVMDRLAVTDIGDRYIAPALARHPDAWERVYASPEGLTQVYRRR